MEIAQRDKFACVAIENAGVRPDVGRQMEPAPGLWYVDRLPFEVGEFWAEQLGRRRLEQIQRSNMLIFAIAPADRPEVLDQENEALSQRVQRTFYSLLMKLVFHHDGAVLFSGARVDNAPNIRQVTDLRQHYRPNVARTSQISRADLEAVAAAEAGVAAYLTRTGGPDRLWHGFHALQRGLLEMWGDERLHQFVRAVEAVLDLPQGRSRTVFANRAQVFVGRSNQNRDWLLELYDLRSATEHMNDYRPLLEAHAEDRRDYIASLRSYEAQALASHVFLRLAQVEQLRDRFSDENALAQFWNLREADQQDIWGQARDIRAHCVANSLPALLR